MRFPWSARTEGGAAGLAVGAPEITSSEAHPDNKNDVFNPTVHDGIGSSSDEDKPSEDAQHGVQAVEAVTLVWSKTQLILAYTFIFLVFFTISLQQQIQNNLSYYVTSSFALLPLVGTTSIVSSIVGGVSRLPIAKFVDLIGRAEGFAVMTGCAVIGLIMMAACRNVETYAAGQVFYWLGFDGMMYVLNVFMADTSSLKDRALVFAFSTTPYIATTWAGPPAAASFLKTSGWPWGYGAFAIITPAIALPILILLWVNQRKAERQGLIKKIPSGRTFGESFNYYFWEFDVIGLVLVSAGFVLFLLPFSLASYQKKGWGAGMIIAMLVIGICCLIAFAFYEKFFAKKSFIPFSLLTDSSVWGACFCAAFFFISFYCWDSYFYNYLQAVHNLSITHAGYVTNIYSIGSCFWAVVIAYLIRITGRFKWLALYFAVPMQVLGVGLMIYFRQPNHNIGYVIMCQIFIAFSGGTIVICEEMAVMAAAPHQNVASMLALIGLFTSVGGAIGVAISGAIYTNKFPAALATKISNATLAAELYGSLTVQLEYPLGSPERDAVIYAYGDSMKWLAVAGTVFLIPCFFFVAIWKDFKVKEMRQVKGTVA
ncbi:siderophore iron transporter protein [Rutstroemia sp. NJR-2017a BBW]|nr:siderophore iron transporter protein [Rutstroemia sp. NJR-2017a BBW]